MTINDADSARIFVQDWNREVIHPTLASARTTLPNILAARLRSNARRFRRCAESQQRCAGLTRLLQPTRSDGHLAAIAVLHAAAEQNEVEATRMEAADAHP